MPNSLSILLVNTETISIYYFFLLYHNSASKIFCGLSISILLQNESQSFKMSFKKGFNMFVNAVLYETEHQEALPDCNIMRLNHETCKALMKVFIFIILSPPAVTSFMITLLLILSGPEFHKKIINYFFYSFYQFSWWVRQCQK